jgi:hypothetical protein
MFEKGNKIWQLADPETVGKPRIFETPEDLWEKAKEYFNYIDENPILKTDFKGKDSDIVHYDLQRPYTWHGLYVFLGVCNLERYKKNDVFANILTHIGNIIYNQKFDGATVGIFNQAIIARDLGLTDKTDITTNGKEINIPVIEWVKNYDKDK